jgi:hypothetical protein
MRGTNSGNGRLIVKWVLKKRGVRAWTVYVWLRTEVSGTEKSIILKLILMGTGQRALSID